MADLKPEPAMLTGMTGVVTDASGDIGRGVVAALTARGMAVVAVGRRVDALEEVVAAARGECHLVAADLTSAGGVSSVVERVGAVFADPLDLLVHCAGRYGRGPTETASVAELDVLYAINVRAPYVLTQELLPPLHRRRGRVVFVGSSQGLNATGNVGQYAVTQHARKAVADSLRGEVNRHGIRVTTLYVGSVASRIQAGIFAESGRKYEPEGLLQPSDVADTIAFCAALPITAEITDLSIRSTARLR